MKAGFFPGAFLFPIRPKSPIGLIGLILFSLLLPQFIDQLHLDFLDFYEAFPLF